MMMMMMMMMREEKDEVLYAAEMAMPWPFGGPL
jgi:hypothetical protein